MDARVKSYFLFDGERIERLTKVTEQQKREIALGIKNLLRIDDLFKVQTALKGLDTKLTKELQKVSTGALQRKLQEKERLEEEQSRLVSEIERLERELEIADAQVRQLNQELEQFKDNAELILKQQQLEGKRDELKESIANVRSRMRKFTPDASVLLAKDVLDQTYVDIDQKRTKGEVPPDIKKELIERLLHEMRCICGREVTPESTEYHLLKAWDLEVQTAEASQEIMRLFSELSRTSEHIDNKSAELIELLQNSGQCEEYLDQVTLELQDLSEQLSTVPDTDLASKNRARESTVKRMGQLEKELTDMRERKYENDEKLKEVERELGPLYRQSKEHQQLARQQELVTKARNSLNRIIDQFVLEVRKELEERANYSFRRLLDLDGQKTLHSLKVKEDYTLEVLDWKNRPFLANISAGQRQIVSLCFITALAQVAGGSNVLEVPLFMDTPFGRLSYEHRQNLLTELPEIAPQWVLLATETELGEREQQQLEQSGRWGRFYYLRADGEGVTTIVDVPVKNLQTSGARDAFRQHSS